jgi:1-acyl-sn-glycerol-3-phosphate acyltransferase
MFVVLEIVRADSALLGAAWHEVTAVYVIPFILLAPVNGALSNSLSKRWLLVSSALWCLSMALLFGQAGGPWLWCMGATALGAAVYSPTRFALLPAAAQAAHLPLPRVNGWIEMGGAAAVVMGLSLGWQLRDSHVGEMPSAIAVTAGLNLVGMLAALPVTFRSDISRREPPGTALRGFFKDCQRIWAVPAARRSLIALAAFLAIATTGSGALVGYTLKDGVDRISLPRVLLVVSAGVAVGAVLAGVQRDLRRSLGQVPFVASGLLLSLAWLAFSVDQPLLPCLALGAFGGAVSVPLRANLQAATPADARGNSMAVMNTANYLSMTALSVAIAGLAIVNVLTPVGQIWTLAGLAALGAGIAWWILRREAMEFFFEIVLWPMYRIRGAGPGLASFPVAGPVLIIANHACWLDPMFLAKVLPRKLIPMMTSDFYDLPLMRWMMKNVVEAIRVQASSFRREAPEIADAVAALDGGEGVVIFPEGRMRRRDNVPIWQFGQGVVQILKQRPATPVVICWIENNWGSFTSYRGGAPTKNKRPDLWRHIDVAVSEPIICDPVLLEDQRATRAQLRRLCLEARKGLGLEPLADTDNTET